MFAKLYERDGRQVLVTLERTHDDGPAVRVSWESTHEDLDVCSTAGICRTVKKAEQAFNRMTESEAFKIADRVDGEMIQMLAGGESP